VVEEMESDYFKFGQWQFLKYFLDSEAVSNVVNGRVLSGSNAGYRTEVAALKCGVKVEAKEGMPQYAYNEYIFIVLLLISGRVSSLAESSLPFKMARIQQLVSGAADNAPDGSSSKERLVV